MNGHGHIVPRADGAKARCGGPGICTECTVEQVRHEQAATGAERISADQTGPDDRAVDIKILQNRCDVADEMLAKLIDDIGTGAGVASLRRQALDIKSELRGVPHSRTSTAP